MEDLSFEQNVSYVCLEEYRNSEASRASKSSQRNSGLQYLLTEAYFNPDGQIIRSLDKREEISFAYNDLGQLSFSVHRSREPKAGDKEKKEHRIYNQEGLLIEKSLELGDRLLQKTSLEYDEDGLLVREHNLSGYKHYLYDAQGYCIEERSFKNEHHSSSSFYSYDDEGKLLQWRQEGPVGKTLRIHRYQYNAYSLLVRYQVINQDSLLIQDLQYDYENYLKQDWLERFTYRLGARGGKLLRNLVHSTYRSLALSSERSKLASNPYHQEQETTQGLYHGELQNGQMHGLGQFRFHDGSSYCGEFSSGMFEGFGVFRWSDGRSYRGYFHSNRMEGLGTYYLADGSLYSGSFSSGQLQANKPYFSLSAQALQRYKQSSLLRKEQADSKQQYYSQQPEAKTQQKKAAAENSPQTGQNSSTQSRTIPTHYDTAEQREAVHPSARRLGAYTPEEAALVKHALQAMKHSAEPRSNAKAHRKNQGKSSKTIILGPETLLKEDNQQQLWLKVLQENQGEVAIGQNLRKIRVENFHSPESLLAKRDDFAEGLADEQAQEALNLELELLFSTDASSDSEQEIHSEFQDLLFELDKTQDPFLNDLHT